MRNSIQTALLFLLLFVAACKKNDVTTAPPPVSPPGKFLSLPPSSPSYLQRISQKIHQQNLAAGFLPQLEQEEGIPVWDKAQVTNLSQINSLSSDTLVLLPLVRDGAKQTTGFIVCKAGKQEVEIIDLVRNRYYADYGFDNDMNKVTANAVALQSMLFDQKIFGDSAFEITDNRLFSSSLAKRTASTKGTTIVTIEPFKSDVAARIEILSPIPTTVCYTVTHKGDEGNLVGAAPGEAADYSYTEKICYTTVAFLPTYPSLPVGGSPSLPGGTTAGSWSFGGTGSASSNLTSWYSGCQDGKLTLTSGGIQKVECKDLTLQPSWTPTNLTPVIKIATQSFNADDGKLSCRSFYFLPINATTNWQEAGVSGLNLMADWFGTNTLASVKPFATLYTGVPKNTISHGIISPGEAAEAAAAAANYAGKKLSIKYYGTPANEWNTIPASSIEKEFRDIMSAHLSAHFNASCSVKREKDGPTIATPAVWNTLWDQLTNKWTDDGCAN